MIRWPGRKEDTTAIVDGLVQQPPESETEFRKRIEHADHDLLRNEIVSRIRQGAPQQSLVLAHALVQLGAAPVAPQLLEIVRDETTHFANRVFAFIALAAVETDVAAALADVDDVEDIAAAAARLLAVMALDPDSPFALLVAAESDDDDAFRSAVDAVIESFRKSDEGRALLEADPQAGGWAAHFMRVAKDYFDEVIFTLDSDQVEEILAELFPRKVMVSSRAKAAVIISEVRAFWTWMMRETKAPFGDEVLELLDEIEPKFAEMMMDERNFGVGKAFLTAGQQAGFDMSDQREIEEFMIVWNAAASRELAAKKKEAGAAKKRKRAMEKASRRKNRRRK